MPDAGEAHFFFVDHLPQATNAFDVGARKASVPGVLTVGNNEPFAFVHPDSWDGYSEDICSLTDRMVPG